MTVVVEKSVAEFAELEMTFEVAAAVVVVV